ncbi:MAG TPA: AAA family ATPase [Polyangia bacterium]|nr:AAA family ATPase [Polyangia bacterium]
MMELNAGSELPATIGPYRVVGVLGRGGMGVVYRAERNGAQVAVKTVPVPRPAVLDSIRREIHALSRLRAPGVVRVLDQGIESGIPWYAMELLEGRTLRDEIGRIWGVLPTSAGEQSAAVTVPGGRADAFPPPSPPREGALSLNARLALIRRLCAPLAFLHGRGLVHRDLKPENVFLRDGGAPVLVDFGVASHFSGARGREVLEVAGAVYGTAYYMAPEQVRGEFVDARADLYAVGCILYELLTGRPPFSGSVAAVYFHHLHTPPEAPSKIAEGVPTAVDELVLKLLQKEPRRRLGYADDLAAALHALDIGGPADAPAQAYLYRPNFYGRGDALDQLERAIADVEKGKGGRFYIGGPSGVGKTRLMMEAASAARHKRKVRVTTGECVAVGISDAGSDARVKAAPLHPFRQLLIEIGDHCQQQGAAETDRLLGARAKLLAPYEPSLRGLPGVDAHPDPPAVPAQAARHRALRALEATLTVLAQDTPAILLLDDLQWADELSIEFLKMLGQGACDGVPLLVVGTYRTEEATPELEELVRAPGARRVVLGDIGAAGVASMVRDMLAITDVAPPFVARLAARSEGNPFFVSEYLCAAVGEGLVRRDSGGRWRMPDGPDEELLGPAPSLRELVGRRLSGLGAPARALARMGAVLGREFDLAVLAAAAGVDEDTAMEAAEELIARNIFEEADGGRLRFSHDKLREIAYAEMSDDERRASHRAAAAAIEAHHGDTPEFALLYPVLAHHFTVAGADDKTFEYLEKAGEQAIGTAAYLEAAGFFGRAIALDDQRGASADPVRRAHWERRLGEARFSLGDLPSSEKHLRSALERLGLHVPSSGGARVRTFLSQAARQAGHMLGFGRSVESRPERLEILKETSQASAAMAFNYYFVNDVLGQIVMSLLSVNQAERANPPVAIAGPYIWLAYTAGLMRLHGVAHTYFEHARANANASDDRTGFCFSLSLEAVYRVGYGHWKQARESVARASAELKQVEDPQHFELNKVVEAQIDFYNGQTRRSRASWDELLHSAQRRENAQHTAWAFYGLARDHVIGGRLDEAIEMMNEALVLLSRTTDRATEMMCYGWLALAHLLRGEEARAWQLADETLTRITATRPSVVFTLDGYARCAEVMLERWTRARAAGAGDAAELGKKASRAVSELGKFAMVFPFGKPAQLRLGGELHAAAGNPRRAARAFAKALDSARALGMPPEEALVLRAQARAGETDARARAETALADVGWRLPL